MGKVELATEYTLDQVPYLDEHWLPEPHKRHRASNMSFGFGISDFLTVGGLCWKLYKKCKDSPGNYKQLTSEVGRLHIVMEETEELLSQQSLSMQQEEKLRVVTAGCVEVLQDLGELLAKYGRRGTKSQRTLDRLGFGTEDIDAIRTRLILNVTLLDAFNNT